LPDRAREVIFFIRICNKKLRQAEICATPFPSPDRACLSGEGRRKEIGE
jgi:hypothetical protein